MGAWTALLWNCERTSLRQKQKSADGRRYRRRPCALLEAGGRVYCNQLSRDLLQDRVGGQADAWGGAHCGATVTRRTKMHESCRWSKVECAQRAGMAQSSREPAVLRCGCRVVGKAIRREAGAQQRAETDEIAQRIRARAVDVAACKLTPSQVLAEVYHHHCTVRGGCLPFATMLVEPSACARTAESSAAPSSAWQLPSAGSKARKASSSRLSSLARQHFCGSTRPPWALRVAWTLVRAGACSGTASERNQHRWSARVCHPLFPSPFSLSALCTHLRGSANTRAHTCGRGFASCEIHTTRHFDGLEEFPSCHLSHSSSTYLTPS